MRNIFSLIIIVLAIVAIFMFGKPLNDEVRLLQAEVSEYNHALDNSTELEKTRDSLIDIYNKISKKDKQKLNSFLPNNADNIDLILSIQKIAREKGVFVKEINFDALDISGNVTDKKEKEQMTTSPIISVENNLPYNIFNLEFVLESNYESFISFTKNLESNLRLININSVSFSAPKLEKIKNEDKIMQQQDPDYYEFILKIETYWLKN